MTLKQLVFSPYLAGIIILYGVLAIDLILLLCFQDLLLTPNMRTVLIIQISAIWNAGMISEDDVNEYGIVDYSAHSRKLIVGTMLTSGLLLLAYHAVY